MAEDISNPRYEILGSPVYQDKWSVVEASTGVPEIVEGVPLDCLSINEAEELAKLMNSREMRSRRYRTKASDDRHHLTPQIGAILLPTNAAKPNRSNDVPFCKQEVPMVKRSTKTGTGTAHDLPWSKIAAGVAASTLASGLVRRLPLGRILVAAAPLIIATLEKNEKRRRS
ncbi:hypothetical protein GGE16_003486 [Rhizobium leguminosarum]|uniref:Uncharacterized protein n=1 Tax=Rhizobium leguminosarum TaxID=384 RepID=A0AAE2MLJ3_RHILE|nr:MULTISPECIES: hypothetical protein [Rhizobium]MBB4291427.1 hypothetical protein [Rhizobium leguminosarum]MBB4296123.1 hypothetical protein [Rhizobium leguminosarum]MBB4308618.1 hypothetical protein [Rhizobium leguminosarum]MBB4416453.1 hypothetical protein [Rhizobium leguminosarum]MBB4430580.1 hypothetical protein [Rhizobium esperanzae]